MFQVAGNNECLYGTSIVPFLSLENAEKDSSSSVPWSLPIRRWRSGTSSFAGEDFLTFEGFWIRVLANIKRGRGGFVNGKSLGRSFDSGTFMIPAYLRSCS